MMGEAERKWGEDPMCSKLRHSSEASSFHPSSWNLPLLFSLTGPSLSGSWFLEAFLTQLSCYCHN